MNYAEISKQTAILLYQSRASLTQSPLKVYIRTLAELRVSQINECVYYCSLHAEEAKKFGMPQTMLDILPASHASPFGLS